MGQKTHWIKESNVGPTKVTTHCGYGGTRNPCGLGYEDKEKFGIIFHVSKTLAAVNCRRCLQSAKRISETCMTPSGNRRRVPA